MGDDHAVSVGSHVSIAFEFSLLVEVGEEIEVQPQAPEAKCEVDDAAHEVDVVVLQAAGEEEHNKGQEKGDGVELVEGVQPRSVGLDTANGTERRLVEYALAFYYSEAELVDQNSPEQVPYASGGQLAVHRFPGLGARHLQLSRLGNFGSIPYGSLFFYAHIY